MKITEPGESTAPRSLAGGGVCDPTPNRPSPDLSPFAQADSRPTFHEWREAILDPSKRARHQRADCHCAAMSGSSPFHADGVS